MKNIFKTLFCFLLIVGLASCNEEVGYPDPGPAGNPEKEIAGTYTGTWTKTNASNGSVTTGAGTITFTPGDRAYVTDVKVESAELKIDMQSLANVVNYTEGYMFYNRETKNGFGTVFDGRIVKGEASIKYSISQKVGLKQTIFNYTFTGVKN